MHFNYSVKFPFRLFPLLPMSRLNKSEPAIFILMFDVTGAFKFPYLHCIWIDRNRYFFQWYPQPFHNTVFIIVPLRLFSSLRRLSVSSRIVFSHLLCALYSPGKWKRMFHSHGCSRAYDACLITKADARFPYFVV